jgi:hypothetical protein
MHIAVRCKSIGLPMVAELMNAKDRKDVISKSVDDEQSQATVRISGAWRIWNEHAGDQTFVQGRPVAKSKNTNPDHVFEIHPISKYGSFDTKDSFKPIEGFTPKETEAAFTQYEQTRSRIRYNDTSKTVTIVSGGLGFNYVKFQMRLSESPQKIVDGYRAFSEVEDWDGELVHRKRRMIFVEATPPAEAAKSLTAGACLRVLGIPRLNLSLVNYRVDQARKGRTEVLTWNLPYELIIVGVYDTACKDEE